MRYADKSPQDLLQMCINEKLAETLRKYNEEIEAGTTFLLSRDSTKVLKALTKIQKRQDKEILEELGEEIKDDDNYISLGTKEYEIDE